MLLAMSYYKFSTTFHSFFRVSTVVCYPSIHPITWGAFRKALEDNMVLKELDLSSNEARLCPPSDLSSMGWAKVPRLRILRATDLLSRS